MPPRIATVKEDDGSFAGLCEGPGCGPYKTLGWPTKAIAAERIAQHQDEHLSGEEFPDDPKKWRYMEDLVTFRVRHGLEQSTENGKLAVFPKGATIVQSEKGKGK